MDDKCSIIDIGSGPGYGLERIKKIRPNVDVCGVDFSTEAAKKSVVPFVQKDIIKDSLSSLSADYVLCIETLEHFKNPYYVLDKIIPIAKKKVILTVPYKENISNHTEHESVFSKKSFREYNIENIKIERRSKGKIMKVVINTSKKGITKHY
jgi:ubiquinone/menaquinone biosynthesis C-methylase UbiE